MRQSVEANKHGLAAVKLSKKHDFSPVYLVMLGIIVGASCVMLFHHLYAISWNPQLRSHRHLGNLLRSNFAFTAAGGDMEADEISDEKHESMDESLRRGLVDLHFYLTHEKGQDSEEFAQAVDDALNVLRSKENKKQNTSSSSFTKPAEAPRETIQTCYLQSDESELCVYSNACFDGEAVVVLTDDDETRQQRDETFKTLEVRSEKSECYDFRYYEGSSTDYTRCILSAQFERPHPLPFEERDPTIDYPLLFSNRAFGPLGGKYPFKKLHPDFLSADKNGQSKVKEAAHCRVPFRKRGNWALDPTVDTTAETFWRGEAIATEAIGCNGSLKDSQSVTAEWMDGTLWFSRVEGGWDRNPFHWSSKVLMLYDALRSNRTGGGILPPFRGSLKSAKDAVKNFETDASQHSIPNSKKQPIRPSKHHPSSIKSRWHIRRAVQYAEDHTLDKRFRENSKLGQVVMGTQWSLPSMDYVAFNGDGVGPATSLKYNIGDLPTWSRGTLNITAPPGTQFLFPPDFQRYTSSSSRLLCAEKMVVTGQKHKFFTGTADAWIFRQYAYQYAGVQSLSHPHHPPRKIFFLDRKGNRNFINRDLVIKELERTGLPFEIVREMNKISFKDQIKKIANSGILLSAHGAGLTNAMFLPQHAVVIEMFPYKLRKTTYSNLAQMMQLNYLSVVAQEKPPYDDSLSGPNHNLLYQDDFVENCDKQNRSSIDTLNLFYCNMPTKNMPINAPIRQLRQTLSEAVKLIGAYSVDNEQWRAVQSERGYRHKNHVLRSVPQEKTLLKSRRIRFSDQR
eukprot:gb/GECG01006512.1/.p1 GENE.gb/GECG01006512.1/~~gb/GECG01006512.1/.p1  ORF type:complete len:791 (+),score=94.48 gb/GECG01006512.1/:1-2373(+)